MTDKELIETVKNRYAAEYLADDIDDDVKEYLLNQVELSARVNLIIKDVIK